MVDQQRDCGREALEKEKKLKVPRKTYLGSGQHPKVTDGKKEEKLHLLHSGLTKAGGPHRTSWQI